MKENTWKHNINSGKAAHQSPACHLQFKLLAAVLGNKDEKLDNDPGNPFALGTATSVQVVLHFFFPGWRKTGWTVPSKKRHLHSCYKEIFLKDQSSWEMCAGHVQGPRAPAQPL